MVNKKRFCLKVNPVFCFQTPLRRTYDDAFPDDDDDEWSWSVVEVVLEVPS